MPFSKIRHIIFDADDTLWINNIYFVRATEAFLELFAQNGFNKATIHLAFLSMERQIVQERGYGSDNFIYIIKRVFTRYRHQAKLQEPDLQKIIHDFNAHREAPPKLFPAVAETLSALHKKFDLYLLTKGQQDEQSLKVERSGLKAFFKKCFILPEKDDAVYARLLQQHRFPPEQTCMVGNSPKSDINPALRNGLAAVWIPYAHTWHLDNEGIMKHDARMQRIETFSQLSDIFSGG